MQRSTVRSGFVLAFLALLPAGCGGSGGSRNRPSIPQGVTAASPTSSEVTLEWQGVTGATDYVVYWSTTPKIARGSATQVSGVQPPHTHVVPANGVRYYYRIATRTPRSESPLSAEVMVLPLDAPIFTGLTPGLSEITLTWKDVAGADSYDLFWSTSPGITVGSANRIPGVSSGFVHGGLITGTTYFYALMALNGEGGGARSALSREASLATLAPPTGVTATAGAFSVDIAWNPVTGATGYNIYWDTSPGVTRGTGTPIPSVTSPHTHATLSPGTTYYYAVTATGPGWETPESLEVSATPAGTPPDRPYRVQARSGDGEVILSWAPVPQATSYTLYWQTTSGVTPASGTPIPAVASPHIHGGLANGTPYYYVLTASNAGGEGPPSFEVSATPRSGGAFDGSFGPGGLITHDGAAGAGGEDRALAIALDGAGNILLTGYGTNSRPDRDMALWRLDPWGGLDPTFGGQGWVTRDRTAGGTGDEIGMDVREDPSGRILVAGYGPRARGDDDMILWAFDPAGAPDASFGLSGVVVHDGAAGGSGHDRGRGMTIDASGMILVTGSSLRPGSDDMAIWRYDPSGSPDGTFGAGGFVVHHNAAGGSGDDVGEAVLVDSLDRIVVAGRSDGFGTGQDMVVWRYDATGALDPSFGSSGVVIHHDAAGGGGPDGATDAALAAGGGIFVTGTSRGAASTDDFVVWSLDAAGALEAGFGTGGIVSLDGPIVGSGTDGVGGIALDAAGRVLVVGYSPNGLFNMDMVLLRLDPAGALDPAFGVGGVVADHNGAGGIWHDYGEDVVLDGAGRILVAGYSWGTAQDYDMVVWRVLP